MVRHAQSSHDTIHASANQLLDDVATCLADPDCRHILVAGGHNLWKSWLWDLAESETTEKVTLTDCLPGYIPLNTHFERLDIHRGAPSISYAALYRYNKEHLQGDNWWRRPLQVESSSREFVEIHQAFTQPFESCKERAECRHFACPFSHVCHTEGCIAPSEEQLCPGGFTLEQHHKKPSIYDFEQEIYTTHHWVRASS